MEQTNSSLDTNFNVPIPPQLEPPLNKINKPSKLIVALIKVYTFRKNK